MNKEELLAKCADLGIETKGLDTNAKLKKAIAAKEAELATTEAKEPEADKAETDKAEADKAEADKAKADKAEAEKAKANKAAKKKAKPPFYKDDRGRKWIFKSTAPKTLNIDGHPMSQEEILQTEEVISELVYGNCSRLTQIH